MRTEGTRVRRGPLSLVFLDDDPAGTPRVAYAITKRVGGAVVRNRLRRRLRAICADLARPGPVALPPRCAPDLRRARSVPAHPC
ncbi:ribonuclease P protein component [Aquihabitans sp. G128]|uniref:ribonuclease P protein component n=1 Tax=Aquihabitans sp. G128 TaxID=2849779 RepID=UPI00352BD627